MHNPQFRGLRPNPHALGVEPLEPDEVSKPVRIRASRKVHEELQRLTPREIGELVAQALGS